METACFFSKILSSKTNITKPFFDLKPPLKWAGGKRWLVPYLKPIWEPFKKRRLVEPLCGGLAVTLGLLPERALLNDINSHLINFFSWLQKGLEVDIPMQNEEKLYYRHRRRFNEILAEGKEHTKEAAELFYYLNRTGYNGLCRFNQKGEFNVPFGKYKNINYCRDFKDYKKLLSNWKFTNIDFEKLVIKKDDFIYADPPYDVEFRQYAKEGFSWNDQVRLAEWLSKHDGPVVLSNQATDRIVELYKKFNFKLYFIEAPRMISCTGDRKPVLEVLALKGVPFDYGTTGY